MGHTNTVLYYRSRAAMAPTNFQQGWDICLEQAPGRETKTTQTHFNGPPQSGDTLRLRQLAYLVAEVRAHEARAARGDGSAAKKAARRGADLDALVTEVLRGASQGTLFGGGSEGR